MSFRLSLACLLVSTIGCSVAVDVRSLENGACADPATKACAPVCASKTDPAFGCASASCASCNTANATATCNPTGECAIAACTGSWHDCNADPADGCEIDVAHDPNHCGKCDAPVCVVAHGNAGCGAGLCAIQKCDVGYKDCNNDPSDGCETSLTLHPGACGTM